MEKDVISDEEILRGLHEHPQIRQRVASLLSAVQDAGGDLKRADDAEQRLTEELTLPLFDVLHRHSITRLCPAGPRARLFRPAIARTCWHRPLTV